MRTVLTLWNSHQVCAHSDDVVNSHQVCAHSADVVNSHQVCAHSDDVVNSHQVCAHSADDVNSHQVCAHKLSLKLDRRSRIMTIKCMYALAVKCPNRFKLSHGTSSVELSA